MTLLSRTINVSRTTIYRWRIQNKVLTEEHLIIKKLVNQVRSYMPKLGSVKLYHLLKYDLNLNGINIGRDKFHKTLKHLCLLVPRKKMFFRTTESNHLFNKHSNLVKGMKLNKPEQLWVSDITYLRTKNGTMYLSLITDAYSKKIMGFEVSDNLKAESSKKALLMAIKNRNYPRRKLIHHSDRGIQYCCPEYTDVLDNHKVKISMTQKYDPYENAIAERINGILKQEFDISNSRIYKNEIKRITRHSINIYNEMRPHYSCNLLTPNQAHCNGKYHYKKWGNFSITEIWN